MYYIKKQVKAKKLKKAKKDKGRKAKSRVFEIFGGPPQQCGTRITKLPRGDFISRRFILGMSDKEIDKII